MQKRTTPTSTPHRLVVVQIRTAASDMAPYSLDEPIVCVNDVNPFQEKIPSGILEDLALVSALRQHCIEIRKAVRSSKKLQQQERSTMTVELSSDHHNHDLLSLNQMVRFIKSKEENCSKIISLVSDDCLAQRVKRQHFDSKVEYLEVLKMHHRAMQAATQVKETMNEYDCIDLEHAVEDLANMYTSAKK